MDPASQDCANPSLWGKELCDLTEADTKCDDHQGCELFKQTRKLESLPKGLKSIVFNGPRYADVTGDLKDFMKNEATLETLILGNSPLITGNLEDLKGATKFDKLRNMDLAGSPLIRGDVDHLPVKLEYVNLASAEGVGGDVAKLPATLIYGNFRSALLFSGTVGAITKGAGGGVKGGEKKCKLRELDLHSSSRLKGSIATATQPVAAAGDVTGLGVGADLGLLERCEKLRYVDLGSSYKGTNAANNVIKGKFAFPTTGTYSGVCFKANGLATPGCQ